MKIFSVAVFFVILTGLVSLALAEEADVADAAAEFYFYRCAGCHTVGGGPLTGPDLNTSIKWSDEDLGIAIKKMEKNTGTLSEADIRQMVEFLKDLSVPDRIAKQRERIEAELQAALPPPSYETGQKLFRGQKMFANGGPACFSCHFFVNEGGTLGPDLTHIRNRASGIVLQSAIENSNYKIMRPIYEKHKISKEESLHLAEYLSHPEKNDMRFSPTLRKVTDLALVGLVSCFVLLGFLNQKRKGPTRKNLLNKHLKG